MNKQGFTLAEVLVTLGIIGVVAAVTTPTLMGSTNSKQLQAQFNNAHSILSQAVYAVAGQKGPGLRKIYAAYTTPDKEKNEEGGYKNENEFLQLFFKQLKTDGKCRYNVAEIKNYNKSKSGAGVYVDKGSKAPGTRLQNGMCVDVVVNASEINITVDINGVKKPNILGHDIFFFTIDSSDKLSPRSMVRYTQAELDAIAAAHPPEEADAWAGQAGDPCTASSNQAGNGLGCAYYALINKNPDDNSKTFWDNLPK